MTILNADQLDLLAPASRKTDPPASRQGAAIKKATAKNDRQLCIDVLEKAGVTGRTAHEIDDELGWRSRSGSPAGKRLSELLKLGTSRALYDTAYDLDVIRLKAMRNRCHIHLARKFYDAEIHGETC